MQPTTEYPTPVTGTPNGYGLGFPTDGSGLTFDAGYPLTFPSGDPGDLGATFPTIMPEVEKIVYERVSDACSSRTMFPDEGLGLTLPAAFSIPPDVGLFAGMDSSYPPVGSNVDGVTPIPVKPIPVVRGWPAYPGSVPAVGVAEATSTEDPAERTTQAGFAGDVFATDAQGNVVATCSYYAEPLQVVVVVELIHTNRDQRDRLHDQLWRVIFPLRHLLSDLSPQVRDVTINAEKQDLPVDEQPNVIYVSVFTVQVAAEALIPGEITLAGTITQLGVTATPTTITQDAPTDDLT